MMALSPALYIAQLQTIATALDSGSTGGLIRLYAGARVGIGFMPASINLLCEFNLQKPCTADLNANALRLKPPADRLCIKTGSATWARLLDSDGRTALDVDVGPIDSGADIELDTILLLAGGMVRLPSVEFLAPTT